MRSGWCLGVVWQWCGVVGVGPGWVLAGYSLWFLKDISLGDKCRCGEGGGLLDRIQLLPQIEGFSDTCLLD